MLIPQRVAAKSNANEEGYATMTALSYGHFICGGGDTMYLICTDKNRTVQHRI